MSKEIGTCSSNRATNSPRIISTAPNRLTVDVKTFSVRLEFTRVALQLRLYRPQRFEGPGRKLPNVIRIGSVFANRLKRDCFNSDQSETP